MASLQFITHETEQFSYREGAFMALEAGCKWIQLRMKDVAVETVRQLAEELKKACENRHALLIIDDYVEVAREVKADGVHLGKNDMPIEEARKLLGEGFIIGGTANTFEDVKRHYEAGADYLGIGPFRFTTTKKNLSPVLGLEGYRNIKQQMIEADIILPAVAIGGITVEDIPAILATGIEGIAMSGAILQAHDPDAEIKRILTM
ncbi:MAG: thiamine phosphate synthase [Bacteroides sp.]|jgi:thiamine-phosphate pyrophosphorylase|uniref:thiamine phosphate synthase n=1 Tax=Bacteroides graminisolvens TaxID=477666 RepID=UPI001B45D272|nr:thiamine phosphate synthase [Bacteroides graminisolvens]MBP7293834.1 thiamine phosphate synthase [Bacteroides sp.]HRF93065.1 thiamine phosphate synthase [Bacteroides graminisolvens]